MYANATPVPNGRTPEVLPAVFDARVDDEEQRFRTLAVGGLFFSIHGTFSSQ
jgi:hypothetical protein